MRATRRLRYGYAAFITAVTPYLLIWAMLPFHAVYASAIYMLMRCYVYANSLYSYDARGAAITRVRYITIRYY